MATTLPFASDAILGRFKAQWDADTPALMGSDPVPVIVYEPTEADLKPHPRDTGKPWARITIRHADATRRSFNRDAAGKGKYQRDGLVWVQIFTPRTGAASYLLAQNLAMVAQKAFEGKRAAGDAINFTKAALLDQPPEGSFWRYDIKGEFYWEEVH